jgi:ribosomal protein S18 acetylase RimI-like enzyme
MGNIGPNLQKVFVHLARSKENCALVAEQDEKLVGSVIGNYYIDLDWEGKTAKLQAIIVDEKHRNQGIGKKLFQHFLTRAKENNCQAVTARVNRKNRKTSNFYKKLNFEEAGTSEYILGL